MNENPHQAEHWIAVTTGVLLAIGAAVKAWPFCRWAWKSATSCVMLIPTMLQAPYLIARHLSVGGGGMVDTITTIERRQIESEKAQAVTRETVEQMAGYQQSLIDLSEDGYWFSNSSGECIRPSAGLCRIVGRNTHEMTGSDWHNSIHPDDRDKVAEAWMNAVRYGRAYELRQRFLRPDGVIVICDVKATTTHSPASNGATTGKVTGWVGRATVVKAIT